MLYSVVAMLFSYGGNAVFLCCVGDGFESEFSCVFLAGWLQGLVKPNNFNVYNILSSDSPLLPGC